MMSCWKAEAVGLAIGFAIIAPLVGAAVAAAALLVTFGFWRVVTKIAYGRWFV